ncbi:hypothetical protein BDV93DRAFT_527943 [Ceratobasidium sp. AG-I]|nr:hypothetical protein BDV93DRAFT_527943 [Ceratobasidium sp. AG-I]
MPHRPPGKPPRRRAKDAGPPLRIYDPAHSLDAEAVLRANYQAAFALLRGNPQRPRLPLELVVYICHLARLAEPHPSRRFSAQRVAPPRFVPYGCIRTSPKPEVLLRTPPLTTTNDVKPAIARIEAVVKSVDGDGYQSDKYWAKFFMRLSPLVTSKVLFDDPSELVWFFMQPDTLLRDRSKLKIVRKGPLSRVRHAVLDDSHGMWQIINTGDCIELGMDSFQDWVSSDMCDVIILVYEAWEPSLAMLRLANANNSVRQ